MFPNREEMTAAGRCSPLPPSRQGANRVFLILLAGLLGAVAAQPARGGGWYVANTAPAENIRYKRVWLSAGTYRFTARAGSAAASAKLHLEVDDAPIGAGIPVPRTGRADAFTYVHLGSKALTQGYHDLKVVFETNDVSLDWFMLTKDADTRKAVKPSDITMVRPDTSGMLIAPIVAFGHVTSSTGGPGALVNYSTDSKLQPYSDAQLEAWYGIPMYQDYDRRSDRYWDVLVEELLASRAQVPLVHCRETSDLTGGLRDRDYQAGPGHFEGRWLVKFAEAVARNPQAVSALKIGMFWENGGIMDLFNRRYGYAPSWGDPALADYVMAYHLAPWFDSIPASMLYQPIPGRPIISAFANHPDKGVNDGRMGDFFAAVRSRMQERYGYDPLFILPLGGDVNPATEAQGWGQCAWGVWNGPLLTPNIFKGGVWGTTCAGARKRLDTVWLNDWNPVTNTGTPGGDSKGKDAFQSRIDKSGNSVLLTNFAQAKAMKMKLVQQEGFTNLAEGNSIYRSFHPGWAFPNQHLAAMREYADPETKTLLFEAEGCDDYVKIAKDGNSGGSYRREWYAGGNDLDIYRPLHNLQSWVVKSAGPNNLTQLSAGFFDTWAVAADGKVWAQHIMGAPDTWKQVTNAPKLTAISVSKEYAWGLSGTTVHSTKLPYGWPHSGNNGWTQRSGSMVQLSAATAEVWGLNASGQVFRRPSDGSGDWTEVAGTLDKICASDVFVWGMKGDNISVTRTSPIAWTQVANPHKLIELAAGSEEVWGVNASGQIFRRSISGIGDWDPVNKPGATLTSLAVGEDYVWALAGGTPYQRKLEGFSGATALPPMINTIAAASGQVTVTWTAVSGATGYHVKRATVAAGPYTTIQSNILPVTAPLSYIDKTVKNGVAYFYVISAVTPGGETANSASVSSTPQGQAPETPTNLVVQSTAGNAITLHWSDTSKSEAGFKVERKSGTGSFVPVGIVARNVTTFSDTSVLSGPDYTYRVRAYNAAGSSPFSNESLVSTAAHRLSRSGWTATASSSKGGATSRALDGDASTRWSIGIAQTGKEWFQVDLGSAKTIYQVDLMTGGGDYPKGYELLLSADGVNWGNPVTAGSGLSGATVITFAPRSARYLRIVQTSALSAWWSINEIEVYGVPGT